MRRTFKHHNRQGREVSLTIPSKDDERSVRTFMIVDAHAKRADAVRYSNGEALEIFGADVMTRVNAGERAMFHDRSGRFNLVVFDVVAAAMRANADIFESITTVTQS